MNPQFLLVNPAIYAHMRQVIAESQSLAEVCSPLGLSRLFPGLRG